MANRIISLGLALLCGSLVSPARAETGAPLVLVFDVSGSMWGQVGGETKIVGARRVIGELGDRLADGTPTALVAYGHRREGDCADIETVLPLAPLDRAALRRAVDRLAPKGKTPLTAAVEQAFVAAPSGATVVLVTDGLETCGGDLCGAVRAARARGGSLVFHVVGFDVAKEDVSSLECAAQVGGGLYLPAADASELARALDRAVAQPASAPTGAFVVRATRNGALQDVLVLVTPEGGGVDLTARTYAKAETNPRLIPLADGTYRVRVRPVGIEGAVEREERITIVDGGRVERAYDYSTGRVAIGATRNGALSDVTYQIFAPGDRERAVATGRTYRTATSNPARATVPAGEYDIVLTAIEIGGKPTVELPRVVVPPNGEAAVTHEFASGSLAVRVARGDALVDAVVAVSARGKAVDQGRTYKSASSNPVRFTLAPGEYAVEVSEIRGEKRRFTLTVAGGAEVERRIDLATAD